MIQDPFENEINFILTRYTFKLDKHIVCESAAFIGADVLDRYIQSTRRCTHTGLAWIRHITSSFSIQTSTVILAESGKPENIKVTVTLTWFGINKWCCCG